MHQITHLLPPLSRLLRVSALGALSTVAAAAATMWLITGSTNPSTWLAAYDHARHCAVADAALSADCTATVSRPAVSVEVTPRPTDTPAAPTPDSSPTQPAAPSVVEPAAPAPAAAPAPSYSEPDDSAEVGGDS